MHLFMIPVLLYYYYFTGTAEVMEHNGIVMDERQRMKSQLAEQELKWRQAYEKVIKENEILRTRGGEAVLATQWRERYEVCLKEKEDLSEMLKIHMKNLARNGGVLNNKSNGGGNTSSGNHGASYQSIIESSKSMDEKVRLLLYSSTENFHIINISAFGLI